MTADADRQPAGPPPHTPGAGDARLRQLWGARIPEITPAVQAQVDDLLAQAREMTGQAGRRAA